MASKKGPHGILYYTKTYIQVIMQSIFGIIKSKIISKILYYYFIKMTTFIEIIFSIIAQPYSHSIALQQLLCSINGLVNYMLNKNTWGVKKCGRNIANRQARPKGLISAEAFHKYDWLCHLATFSYL